MDCFSKGVSADISIQKGSRDEKVVRGFPDSPPVLDPFIHFWRHQAVSQSSPA